MNVNLFNIKLSLFLRKSTIMTSKGLFRLKIVSVEHLSFDVINQQNYIICKTNCMLTEFFNAGMIIKLPR